MSRLELLATLVLGDEPGFELLLKKFSDLPRLLKERELNLLPLLMLREATVSLELAACVTAWPALITALSFAPGRPRLQFAAVDQSRLLPALVKTLVPPVE